MLQSIVSTLELVMELVNPRNAKIAVFNGNYLIFSGLVPTWAAMSFFKSPTVSSSLHFTRTFFPNRSLQITSIMALVTVDCVESCSGVSSVKLPFGFVAGRIYISVMRTRQNCSSTGSHFCNSKKRKKPTRFTWLP